MGGAVCVSNRIIVGSVRECAVAVVDAFAVLDVETTYFRQSAGVGIVIDEELSNERECGVGVIPGL